MTREIALHCMKSYSEFHSDLCELCPIYGQTGSDHCFEDALEYVIKDLEQEPILDKIYADIQKLRGCSCSCSDGIIDDIENILDKYKAESEEV
jgi:hypothetical protein